MTPQILSFYEKFHYISGKHGIHLLYLHLFIYWVHKFSLISSTFPSSEGGRGWAMPPPPIFGPAFRQEFETRFEGKISRRGNANSSVEEVKKFVGQKASPWKFFLAPLISKSYLPHCFLPEVAE